jgi:hypothetical protein
MRRLRPLLVWRLCCAASPPDWSSASTQFVYLQHRGHSGQCHAHIRYKPIRPAFISSNRFQSWSQPCYQLSFLERRAIHQFSSLSQDQYARNKTTRLSQTLASDCRHSYELNGPYDGVIHGEGPFISTKVATIL